MNRLTVALVVLLAADAAAAQEGALPPQPNALPVHALKRLGSWTQRQRRPVTCVTFVDGVKSLLASNDDGTVTLWDLSTGDRVRQFVGHEEGVKCVAVSPDRRSIATAGWEGSVRLWDPATGKQNAVLRAHEQGVSSVAFSPDGRWLASGSSDATVRLWNLQGTGGKEERRFKTAGGRPVSVAFSPDGKLLAAGGTDKAIHFWDLTTGQEVRTIKEQPGWILHIAFSPDGRLLAAGGNAGSIGLWDVARGKPIRRLQERAEVLSVAFAPDGKTLASGTYDSTVHLWEVTTGQRVWSRVGHANGVLSVAFAGDGRTIASGSSDTTAVIWDATALRTDGKLEPMGLTALELESCWRALADGTAADGQLAVWRLVAAEEQGVRLLRDRLKPIRTVAADKLLQLIKDLNSDRFAVRQKASAELERLDELAISALQTAWDGNPSAESRRRLSFLMDKAAKTSVPPERLRGLRAIQVLEQIGSDEARQVLKQLAGGPRESTLAAEARASCERLRRHDAEPANK